MDLGHALVEVHTVIFLLGDADVGARGERVVLLLDFLNGGDFAQASNVLILALTEFARQPLKLAGGLERILDGGNLGILLCLNALLVPALGVGDGFLGLCFLVVK